MIEAEGQHDEEAIQFVEPLNENGRIESMQTDTEVATSTIGTDVRDKLF
jgi:hypothetical protein